MLYNLLKNYTLEDAIKLEYKDRQFLAYKKFFENKKISDKDYLFLILQNALISYQLSGKGENYHEEFVDSAIDLVLPEDIVLKKQKIYNFFENFLKSSKNNKRFISTKLIRIKKSLVFYDKFKPDFYYKNMYNLAEDLSRIMNQSIKSKTIVFSVKMFSYGARNVFGFLEKFPENLMIPIDSRLEKLFELSTNKNKYSKKEIENYYKSLSLRLNIPLLHLDALLWVNYENLLGKFQKTI